MNKNDKIAIVIAICLFIFSVFYGFFKTYDIIENGIYTKGRIIDEYYIGSKHYIKYEFYVNNRKYIGEQRTSMFKCDDGIVCCVNREFEILYSKKKPNNSDIDLGKYNKYKSGTKLHNLFKN